MSSAEGNRPCALPLRSVRDRHAPERGWVYRGIACGERVSALLFNGWVVEGARNILHGDKAQAQHGSQLVDLEEGWTYVFEVLGIVLIQMLVRLLRCRVGFCPRSFQLLSMARSRSETQTLSLDVTNEV